MNIAVLHYHLHPGGVARVIEQHLCSLDIAPRDQGPLRVLVLHGGDFPTDRSHSEEAYGHITVQHRVVPALDYDESQPQPQRLADLVRFELQRSGFEPRDTVLHCHNHALGKNHSWIGVVHELARRGFGLLLQLHDFAEDFRPHLYRPMLDRLAPGQPEQLSALLYPQGSRLHYVVLNSRDHGLLASLGVEPHRLHLLPNPIAPAEIEPCARKAARVTLSVECGVPQGGAFLLVPSRGIRRKNLGEALLWSILLRDRAHVGFTLPPDNPQEQRGYQDWVELACEHRLPCHFGLGADGRPIHDMIAAADALLTTSVAEGFGLAFLEGWAMGRALVGRDLPELTNDFRVEGLRFPGLRPALLLPPGTVDEARLQVELNTRWKSLLSGCGLDPARLGLADDWPSVADEHGLVDFGLLETRRQGDVVSRAARDAGLVAEIQHLNPHVESALDGAAQDAAVEPNAAAVRRRYSRERCGQDLLQIYESVCAAEPVANLVAPARPLALLRGLLRPSRLRPLVLPP